jgi:hypothetical protein
MSNQIKQLLSDPEKVKLIRQKLPPAFQIVEAQLKGNPAVGLLREQVIIGMLIALLREDSVKSIEGGVNPDIDCYVDSEPLSIKTVSYKGGIRLKWTSNAVKAREFIKSYEPMCNMLVVRIVWEDLGEMRFIPLILQQRIFRRLGVDHYLEYSSTTNTRGVNLSQQAEEILNAQLESTNLSISWQRSGIPVNPMDKWVDYWLDKSSL